MNKRTAVRDAARALSNLNIFAGVVALLEGGTVDVFSDLAARQIIRICQQEQQRCLRRYDKLEKLAQKEAA